MEAGLLVKREFEYLSVDDFNIPTFYCIPKVHKSLEKPLERPIVSAICGSLDRIGGYLDSLLKEMVCVLKSYMQDTRHILAKISDLKIEGEAWLIGIDVESLYISIAHDCGIRAVKTFLDKHYPQFGHQKEFVIDLLQFSLFDNFFQFSSCFYQQFRGTSLGAAWAPAYACLYLGL